MIISALVYTTFLFLGFQTITSLENNKNFVLDEDYINVDNEG